MTPPARHQAAIDILDRILAGAPAEQALTGWARSARFAGSKDRAAIRDLVFDALRCRRSFAHLGGAETGRGLILGSLRAQGIDPDTIFTGAGYGPSPLTPEESAYSPEAMNEAVALDCPDWVLPQLRASLGEEDTASVLRALQSRAPVFLRVNLARTSLEAAIAALALDQIAAQPHPLAPTALEVTGNARALQRAHAYLNGLVELQDAASQAVITALPSLNGARVLDYCAGGGGKALALAAQGARVTAHDANPARMRDLPERAARAQVDIALADIPEGPFDLVLTDVPCSGSGSWRRAPAGKWLLTEGKLAEVQQAQAQILDRAAQFVREGGWLAYVTCSMLQGENQAQIGAFLARNAAFALHVERCYTPLDGGDGFYLALLRCEEEPHSQL